MPANLQDLLRHPAVFRVGDAATPPAQTVPTGFVELDRELSGGGWPRPGLAELLCDAQGIGELSLILPAHRLLAGATRLGGNGMLWVAPPQLPYAPALLAAGVNLARLVMVKTQTAGDALWAAEQGLLSGSSGIVSLWLNDGRQHEVALRRLSQTATMGNALCLLMRPLAMAARPSPAQLRIAVAAADQGALTLSLIKRRGLAPGKSLRLETRALACLRRAPVQAQRHAPGIAQVAADAWMQRLLSLEASAHAKLAVRER